MNPDLLAKVLVDLEKSGFGSEMRAARALLAAGWDVDSGVGFFDRDRQVSREFDIDASYEAKRKDSQHETVVVGVRAVIEVKKSTKPWVVFRNQIQTAFDISDYFNTLAYAENLPSAELSLLREVYRDHLRNTLRWKGYGIHESFKNPTARSRWYSAFVTTSKAASESLAFTKRYAPKPDENIGFEPAKASRLTIFRPVVILDGQLLSAELDDTGEIHVEEITAAPFEFHYRSAKYKQQFYRLDVVTLLGLHEYLESWRQRLESASTVIERLRVDKPR
jgi:hypothetical protein